MASEPGRLGPLDEVLRGVRGRALTREERDGFGKYLDLLVLWNRTHDLTACRTAAEIVTKLFVDSLLFLPLLPHPRAGRLRAVDIGAGAGIPGIPLRLVMPSLDLVLIESRRKRVSFLRAAQRELRLSGVEIIEGRAEEIVRDRADLVEQSDLVVSRGVSADDLLPAALTYLRPGGRVVAGGPPHPDPGSLPEGIGYAQVQWRQVARPGRRGQRTLLVATR